jgi:5'-nucleotidase
MRVLITNDDGVDSVGIQVLAAAIAATGDHEVLVVAPADDRSGTGAALGSFSPSEGGLEAVAVTLPDAPGVAAWALEGTPAMCVLAAALGGFGERPELIVSGINAGLNTGRAVLHSGTVGAVLTGQNFGISGLAVSTALDDPWRWDTAAAFAVQVLPMLLDAPPRSALNLNVPALPESEVRGIRWARLAPFGETRAAFVSDHEPADGTERAGGERRRLRMELRLAEHDFDDDTDTGVVRDGWAALTTLVGVVEAWPGDHQLDGDAAPGELVRSIVPGAPLDPAHRIPDAAGAGALRRPVIVT